MNEFRDAAAKFLAPETNSATRRILWAEKVFFDPMPGAAGTAKPTVVLMPFSRAMAKASALEFDLVKRALHRAIETGIDLNAHILRHGSLSDIRATPLHDAIDTGTPEYLALLIANGADPMRTYQFIATHRTPKGHDMSVTFDAFALLEHFGPRDREAKGQVLASWRSRRAVQDCLDAASSEGPAP